nr:error-prone DNA polymerase [Spelaeicoccus albus]
MERKLSDRAPARPDVDLWAGRRPAGADGNDAPAWSRKREPPEPRPVARPESVRPYAELHAHSTFSFLDGASGPEELAAEAARLGLTALALTDHDGLYGVVRFAQAAKEYGLDTVFGAELSLDLPPDPGGANDPPGEHLLVLARGITGYRSLSAAITAAQLAGGAKGRPVYDLDKLAEAAGGDWLILTGCRKSAVGRALASGKPGAPDAALGKLVRLFGPGNVVVELTPQGFPDDDERLDALAGLAEEAGLPIVATGNVHYAAPDDADLAAALASVRARGSLDDLEGWLPPSGAAHLRSGEEMARLLDRYPRAVENAARFGAECAFELHLAEPALPPFGVPDGHTYASWLRELSYRGAERLYGPRPPSGGDPANSSSNQDDLGRRAWAQIDRELHVIEKMNFPGYFLIVWDIAEFCRGNNIFCQGRGSAANSAVCYVLGITAVDAVHYRLLFDRFLAPDRDGYPDIDLDIESARREEVIQYVYTRYGRAYAAQVANVISYRPRSAVRDMAKALGHAPGQQDAWAKQIDRWRSVPDVADGVHSIPEPVVNLANRVLDFPRHLGIHSGGMVLADRPVGEVCPVEWGRMPGRTVLQWDKDDCADMKLVKFDLLGLGMLGALHEMVDQIEAFHGQRIERATIPPDDPDVYEMLCRADAIGVFQVESRAQLATLPRLKPRTFYDLAIEVALIRPGPIQGGSVHPYIRRRSGEEPVTYLHPLLEKSLRKTLGVPLFQEQLMAMAIDVAGFSGADADELRRAMGNKRSLVKMQRLRARFFDGMAANGITGDVADKIYEKMEAFANYGFPESHSISFAGLVYQSAWLKYYYPAAFCVGLLRSQPMGFYSPQSLITDARRHGVPIHRVDINASAAGATVQAGERPDGVDPPVAGIRLGLDAVRGLGSDAAAAIEAERAAGEYVSVADLTRRVRLSQKALEALATSGAFDCLGETRRSALWTVGGLAGDESARLPGTAPGTERGAVPTLPSMTALESSVADLWATGMTPDGYPTVHLRRALEARGVLSIEAMLRVRPGKRVLVAGVVTHRQRPATASGVTFINLEDETGMLNVVCSQGLWHRYRPVATRASALLVHGRVERKENVVSFSAEKLERLPMEGLGRSRDFQ